MANALTAATGSLPWGQSKKTETSGSGSTTPPSTSEPTASEPTPATAEPAAPDPTAKTYSAPPASNQVALMPDRLRDLIIGYASEGMTTRTPLIEIERIASSPASDTPVSAEQVQQTRAEIIANASAAMIAQANHTRDSVSALLNLSAAA